MSVSLIFHLCLNLSRLRSSQVAPSSKVAVFDFDGTLANPMVCMGQRCPEHVWGAYKPCCFSQWMVLDA